MVSSKGRVGIVGAGTSGIYLASLLDRQGYEVSLFEKASYPRTDGCGIFLIQAGMKALDRGNPDLCRKLSAPVLPCKLSSSATCAADRLVSMP